MIKLNFILIFSIFLRVNSTNNSFFLRNMSLILPAKVALCDIEGTTTSISFVKNVLFPFSQNKMREFLSLNWNNSEVNSIVSELLKLSEANNAEDSNEDTKQDPNVEMATKKINSLIEKDYKIQPLKTLQGLIWEKGYLDGSLKGHVYPDTPIAFERWTTDGIKLYIYSSGSEKAQKLLFSNSESGDLLKYITGHFDTRIGAKIDYESYGKIINNLGCKAEDVVFFTDIPKEAYAAKKAGLKVILLDRPGNGPLSEEDKIEFPVISTFDQIKLELKS